MSHPSALAASPFVGQPKLPLCPSCAFPPPHSVHHEGSTSPDAKRGVFTQDCSTDGDFVQYRSASSELPSKSFLYKMNHRKQHNLEPDAYYHPRSTGYSQDGGMEEGGWKVQRSVQRPWYYPYFKKHPSVPEHSGGKVLHSGMHKTVIHKVILPPAIINHHRIPLTAPKSSLAQPGKCPGPPQMTQQAG